MPRNRHFLLYNTRSKVLGSDGANKLTPDPCIGKLKPARIVYTKALAASGCGPHVPTRKIICVQKWGEKQRNVPLIDNELVYRA